jgi:hypothetical protein
MKGTLIGLAIVAVTVAFALAGPPQHAQAGYGCHGPTPAAGCAGEPLAGGHLVYGCSGFRGPLRGILLRGPVRGMIRDGIDRRQERRMNRRSRRAARWAAYGCQGVPVGCQGPAAAPACQGG